MEKRNDEIVHRHARDDAELALEGGRGRAVDAALSAISNALAQGESVSIARFGTFSLKHRAPRRGRNSRTGEPIAITASQVPSFKVGKGRRDAVD